MLHDFSWGGLAARAALAVSSTPSALSSQTYSDRCSTAIERLQVDWYNNVTGVWANAWWNSANALTTLAEFTSMDLDAANKLNIGGIMEDTFTQAQKTAVRSKKAISSGLVSSVYCIDDGSGCMSKRDFIGKRGFADFLDEYYDDEGWWALAWIRSYDVAGDPKFLTAAIDIYNNMKGGLGSSCGTASAGIYWSKDRTYVNAIANELFLSVSASLARRLHHNNTEYLETAKAQWAWFEKSGLINSDNLINDGLDDKCNNNKMQTWSYNQGVILGGLVELSLATGDKSLLDKANKIAKSAIKSLSDKNGILQETDDCELKDGHCGSDGQQFKGVFIRNLKYLHTQSPQDEYADFIIKNANSIWKNDRDGSDRLGVSWAGPYVEATAESHSSALDCLVAALAIVDNK